MLRLSRRQAIRTVTLNTVALNLALAATAALPGGETAEAASWHATGLGGLPVSLIALDRSAPGVIYAAVHGGGRSNLRKTANGGQTWVALERGLPAGIQPTALAVSPDEGRVVLVAGVDGLFRSTSGGATWTDVRQPLPTVTALLFDGANPHIALAGTELRGNFRSTDGGRTWRPAHLGLSRDRYGATPGAVRLAQHPTEPRTIYMGTNGFAGVYRSEDGGQSWQSASNGLSSPIILALAVNPAAPDVLLAVTGKGLTRSSDGGGSWQAVDSLPAIDPVAVQFEPEAKETIYVASERGPLYRSTNGGSTWVELPSLPRPVRTLTTWPAARAPMLAAGAGEGLWQLALPPTLPASPEPPGRDRQYFGVTGHNVSPIFYPFYQS
ncbi:MAG: WD40/YVTN/BNR-like repeat-containing protein, partial [Chloroflexota bacterium]